MRLFLAIELPAEVTDALRAARLALEPRCRTWRWVRAEGVHLTLRFLGEVVPEDDAGQRAAWRAAAAMHGPLRFRLGAVGTFPGGRRPRVLWVGVGDERPPSGLAALAEELERAARRLGFEPETRGFHPHLTLARAARGGRGEPPPDGFAVDPVEVGATVVSLMRSELGRGGACYTALERYPLGGGE